MGRVQEVCKTPSGLPPYIYLALYILSYNCPDDKGSTSRTSPDKLHHALQSMLEKSSYSGREEVDYWAAFTAENAVDRSKRLSKPSDLYMISGNQSFAKKVMNLYENTDERLIHEALYATWKYASSHEYSMGWDPVTLRMHVVRKKAPTDDTSPLCEIGAEWLAFHSLPLFPVFSSQGQIMTTGFEKDRFMWPIWKAPISYDTLRTLVQSLGSVDMGIRNGITALYQSYRISMAKGYGSFTPAEPAKIRRTDVELEGAVHVKTPL